MRKSLLVSGIWKALVVIALGGAAYGLSLSSPEVQKGSEQGVIMTLPETVGSFQGEDQEVSESERVILPEDTEFARKMYRDASGDQINAQIVLAGGEKRSIHRPEICLPAQGWNIKTGQAVPMTLNDGTELDVMRLDIARPVEVQPGVHKELRSIFLYWFVGKNMTTPHHWQRLAHANWDRVLHNINHRWAYIVVSAPVLEGFSPNGKGHAETEKMLKEFLRELAPQIMSPEVRASLPRADAAGS